MTIKSININGECVSLPYSIEVDSQKISGDKIDGIVYVLLTEMSVMKMHIERLEKNESKT